MVLLNDFTERHLIVTKTWSDNGSRKWYPSADYDNPAWNFRIHNIKYHIGVREVEVKLTVGGKMIYKQVIQEVYIDLGCYIKTTMTNIVELFGNINV